MSWAFHHGWALNRRFWEPLLAVLGTGGAIADRGYFGPAQAVKDGAILVGHSLGALLALRAVASGTRALIAINGFDRFAAGPGFPGVARRPLDAMIARAGAAPGAVARDFRARCGIHAPLPGPPTMRLRDDLLLLRDAGPAALPGIPMLLLDGGADPILAPHHRAATFAGAAAARRETLGEGGHLLPLTHPAWCAERITRFASALG